MTTLNPRVDFAFKKLFGTEENKEILISFINAVVSEADRVSDVILLNPYNHKEHSTDKLSILDIKATDKHGRQYNIEMQITDQVFYNQRSLYYWSKLYASQLKEGDPFDLLKKTISINVLNFNYFDAEPNYHNVFKLLHVESHKRYFEEMELHFIELEKFDADIKHLKTALDRWASFLKKAHKYDKGTLPKELSKDTAIEKAFMSLTTLSLDKDEREVYEARLKWLRDEDAALKKAHEVGQLEGMEKAMQKVALNMLMKNMSVDTIIELTGLTDKEIEQLKLEITH